jgi:hypothetical protein
MLWPRRSNGNRCGSSLPRTGFSLRIPCSFTPQTLLQTAPNPVHHLPFRPRSPRRRPRFLLPPVKSSFLRLQPLTISQKGHPSDTVLSAQHIRPQSLTITTLRPRGHFWRSYEERSPDSRTTFDEGSPSPNCYTEYTGYILRNFLNGNYLQPLLCLWNIQGYRWYDTVLTSSRPCNLHGTPPISTQPPPIHGITFLSLPIPSTESLTKQTQETTE